jgi:OmcA/MtrC family decaheme c-type cytochrome
MKMKCKSFSRVGLFLALTVGVYPALFAQEYAWDQAKYFQYNIERVTVDTSESFFKVGVVFSVTDPTGGQGTIKDKGITYWDIKNDPHFTGTGARLAVDIGWNTVDFVNTGTAGDSLPTIPQARAGALAGAGAALPVVVTLTGATGASVPCPADGCGGYGIGRYVVRTILPTTRATGTGRVALEGRPVWLVNGVLQSVPVKSVFQDVPFTNPGAVARRQIVTISKCKECHTGTMHDGELIPRLSLHGANRTEELEVCVICHNPNQTDIPYRTSGVEASVNFTRMVHGIHAGGFRENPLIIIGRGGTVNDFSAVRFPAELRECTRCHLDSNGRGTFELPINTKLGSTINTGSSYSTVDAATGKVTLSGYVDTNPANDLKITPTAAACSACHDKAEVRTHMVRTGGASFSTTQGAIDNGRVMERCVNCHGRGKEKDVRRAHEIGRSDN